MGIDPRVFRTDPSDPTKLVLATQEEPAAPADQLVREDTFTNRIGATTDPEAVGDGAVIAILKRLRTLLAGGLPAALTAGGSLKVAVVEAIAAGVARIGKVTIRNAADAADIDPLAEGTWTARFGEVQAVPTANTLLGRLKDIYDRLLAGGKTLKSKDFSISATGVIVAAVVGKKIRVYAYKFVVAGAVSVNWRSGGATNLEGAQPYAANSGAIEGVTPPAFLFETAQGQSLDLVLSGAITVAGRVSYWDDDA